MRIHTSVTGCTHCSPYKDKAEFHRVKQVMASKTPQLDLCGYDFKFLSYPPDALVCPICTFVARDPQQMNCCGRVYCQLCLFEHKKNSIKCPCCRQTGNSFTDTRCDKEIKALKIKCTNETDGCKWVNELCCLERHLKSCDYTLVSCDNECLEEEKVTKVFRKNLRNHLKRKCPRRQFECPHCHKTGEYQERVGTHLDTCPYVSTDCPNEGCHKRFPRLRAKEHAEGCDYQPVTCKYTEVGCTDTLLRKDLKKHEEDDQIHLRITTENALKLKRRVVKLESRIDELENQPLTCKYAETGSLKTRKNLKEHEEDHRLSLLQGFKCMKEIKLRLDKEKSEHHTFKVKSFNQFKKSNSQFSSPLFYLKGYCIHLEIKVNGDTARGTHISVYANISKGKHDAHLSWPFTGTVNIELLNQLEDDNHHKKSIEFNRCNTRVFFENIPKPGLGYPQFIAHYELHCKPEKNCQYLRDDTLVFRVSVDLPDHKPWLDCTVLPTD